MTQPTGPATLAVPAAPAVPVVPDVGLAEDGRIRGIDGMLNQVAGAAMRQARVELWPAWQADTAMQRTVGEAVGRGAASTLAPWVALGATSLAVGAAALVFRAWRGTGPRGSEAARNNPRNHRNNPRRTARKNLRRR